MGVGPEQVEAELRALEHWGTMGYARGWADWFEKTEGTRPPDDQIRATAKSSRSGCTPDVALAITRIWWETDIRGVLPSLRVPALLIADESRPNLVEVAEYVGSLIPDAVVRTFDLGPWPSREGLEKYLRPIHDAVRQFVGVEPPPVELDSILASVLFTDIVGSTERQAVLGDHAWKDLVEHHHVLVRAALSRWRGVENDTAGDGFFATFDGPARAIRCAMEITERVRDLGVEVRAGVHTGECEVIDGKVGGIAVTIGARISALAAPSQVLISQTVKDLVAGSGLTFQDAGEHELKGVPDNWHLYAALV